MKRLAAAALVLALVVIGAGVFVAWVVGTEPGLRWTLARALGASGGRLEVEGASGTLATRVHFTRLSYRDQGLEVEMREVGGRIGLGAALGGRLFLDGVRAASLHISLAERTEKRKEPPVLGFGIGIAQAQIGELVLERKDERYALRNVAIEHATLDAAPGTPVSAVVTFTLADERFPASGRADLEGSLESARLSLRLQGREIALAAQAQLAAFAERPLRSLEARAGPVDLSRFDASLPQTALELALKGEATNTEALRGSLYVRNGRAGALDAGRLPLVRADANFATADFTSLRLEDLRMRLAGGGRLEGRAQASLERVEARLQASGIDLRAIRSDLRHTALSGPLEALLTHEQQSLDAALKQEGMSIEGHVLRRGSVVEVHSLRAAAAGGEVSGSGRFHLDSHAFQAEAALSRFNPAAFGDYPEGSIDGKLSTTGRLAARLEVAASWTLSGLLLELGFESSGSARFAPQRVTQADARARLGETRVAAKGSFGQPGDEMTWSVDAPRLDELAAGLEGRARASGAIAGSWERPTAWATGNAEALRYRGAALERVTASLAGTLARHDARITVQASDVDLHAELRGGWQGDAKSGAWSGELLDAGNAGRYPLRLASPAPLKLARERVEIGRLEARLQNGRILVRDFLWTPQRLATTGEFRHLPAHWLILAAGAAQRLESTLLVDGDWSIRAAPRLDGAVRLQRAEGDLVFLGESPLDLGLSEAWVNARLAQSRVSIEGQARARFGSVSVGGEIQPEPEAPGIALTPRSALALQASVAFAEIRSLAHSFLEEGRLDGRLSAEAKVTGTLGEPAIDAKLRGEALAIELPPYGVYLKNGQLVAALEGDRLKIESFTIQGGDGVFTASGSAPLRLADGDARIAWEARKFMLLDRPDMRLVTSGKGEAHFDGTKLALSGDLRADRGVLEFLRDRLPQLGDDVWIAGKPRPVGKQRAHLPIALDVHLDLGEDLQIRSQGLEGKLGGHLDFATGRDGELLAYGKLQLVNATFFAYGQKLQVDPGILVFDGPLDNPSLQIIAWRRNQQVEAGVQVTGSVRAPLVQIVSQPPVPEGERLSWLVLGRPPSDATKADLGMLQAAAGALLARGDSMPLDRKIARSVGLDEVTLRGTGEAQDRVVALGKRISDRVYISYEQGIGTVASNLVKLDYSLSRRWSLRAETGTSSGGGLFYRFSWD